MKVIFTRNYWPASIAIRVLTASRWHHCGIVDGQYVIEASAWHGVRRIPIGDFKCRGQWAIYEVPLQSESEALDWVSQQLEKPYDWLGVFGLMLSHNWHKENRWYCSELVAAAAAKGGTPIVRASMKGVTPRDLWALPYEVTHCSYVNT